MKRVVIWFFSLALMGCATTANYEAILDSYVGANVDELIVNWGPPDKEAALSNGDRILEYRDEHTGTSGGGSYTVYETQNQTGTVYTPSGPLPYSSSVRFPVTHTMPVFTSHVFCVTRFKVSKTGIVLSYTYKGNDCVAK